MAPIRPIDPIAIRTSITPLQGSIDLVNITPKNSPLCLLYLIFLSQPYLAQVVHLGTTYLGSRRSPFVPPPNYLHPILLFNTKYDTYDHRVWKTGLPVRSAVLKPHAGELVVGWVTTSESSLLYVILFLFLLF